MKLLIRGGSFAADQGAGKLFDRIGAFYEAAGKSRGMIKIST